MARSIYELGTCLSGEYGIPCVSAASTGVAAPHDWPHDEQYNVKVQVGIVLPDAKKVGSL